MAQVVLPYTYQAGQTIVAANEMANLQAIVNQVNGNIDNTNLASGLAITDSHLNQITSAAKVSGTALTGLASIPSGAGVIPAANLTYVNVQYPYVKCSNTQNSGTGGGTTTSGSFLVAILNTTDNDTQSISSLASNQVTLPAGTYLFSAFVTIVGGQESQIRLYNVTGSAVLINGQSTDITSSTTVGLAAHCRGLFTLATSSAVELQYFVTNGVATNGLGYPTSAGTEVYAVAEFTKTQ